MATHQKKHKNKGNIKKEIIFANDTESYGLVTSVHGGSPARFNIEIILTRKIIIASASGKLKYKKQIIRVGDIVLVDDGNQIQLKYSEEEIKILNKMKKLVSYKQKTEDSGVDFEDDTNEPDKDDEIDISAI